MTIASTETKTIYAGNGSTGTFAIPFMFLQDEDIEVILSAEGLDSTQTISTDYQLSGAGNQMGGTCTMSTPPQSGETLVIRRDPALVQEVDYVENDAFPAATHEAALDKLTMICQALSERLDRTITFRVSSAVSGVELPDPEAGEVLTWNSSGDNLANTTVAELGAVELPVPINDGGTGATTVETAQINLGLGSIARSLAAADDTSQALSVLEAEPADTAILKADSPDMIEAVYGEDPQVYTGPNLSGLVINRNHIMWTLDRDSSFSGITLPYTGTYVFHIYPNGYELALSSSIKSDSRMDMPSPTAGEIRIAVEKFNGRVSFVSLQNLED